MIWYKRWDSPKGTIFDKEYSNADIREIPPTNGWMVELGYGNPQDESDSGFKCGYRLVPSVVFLLLLGCRGAVLALLAAHNMPDRIYISGDTLMVDDLKAIPQHYKGQNIDLMLIHLGGTTIPSPSLPLLMVTMDAKQGLELVKLICPDMTIPIHYEYVAPLILG
jgi:hypothetical protein